MCECVFQIYDTEGNHNYSNHVNFKKQQFLQTKYTELLIKWLKQQNTNTNTEQSDANNSNGHEIAVMMNNSNDDKVATMVIALACKLK